MLWRGRAIVHDLSQIACEDEKFILTHVSRNRSTGTLAYQGTPSIPLFFKAALGKLECFAPMQKIPRLAQ